MKRLVELCKQYTNLDEDEIRQLIFEAKRIEQVDDYEDYDVFIDVKNQFNGQAVVVYHKLPQNGRSLYRQQVVGKDALRENEPGVFHTFETKLKSVDLLAETQEHRLIRQRIYPIAFNNRTIGVTIVESDVSQDVLDNFQGRDLESRYNDVSATIQLFGRLDKAVTNQLADAVLGFDQSGHLVLANRTAIELYQKVGYIGNIFGLTYDNLSLDGSNFAEVSSKIKQVQDDEQPLVSNFNYLNYFFRSSKFWNKQNRQLVILIQDKTDVKRKEAEIISKSVAIREINHRVKNNLQSVISLLRIQQRRIQNPEAKKALNESVSRIMAIASTYELMSKQLDDETNLKAAIQLLISHFVQLNDSATKLKIKLDIDSTIVVDNDQIVTISIIINELLQNVVSHAFPNGIQKDSQVSIIGQAENGIITIRVQDNGVGFDLDQTRSGSLGLMIIRSYVSDKLLGRLKIKSSSRGTVTSFSFDQQTQH